MKDLFFLRYLDNYNLSEVRYFDDTGNIYSDFADAEKMLIDGKMVAMDALLEPLYDPTHYTDTGDYCCDNFEFLGWDQPNPDNFGAVVFKGERYNHHRSSISLILKFG